MSKRGTRVPSVTVNLNPQLEVHLLINFFLISKIF